MKYPNSKKTYEKPKISTSHRGMDLEDAINKTNEYYLKNDIAVIYKKPTPIQIVTVDYPSRNAAKITEAYFKIPSTTDYNGIYKGKYIDFEAKEIHSKTSFPFQMIHAHQIDHLKRVKKHGGVTFIILRMVAYDKTFLIDADEFIKYKESVTRKSLPFCWILENGHEIKENYGKPCDYLKVLNDVYDF